MYHTCRVTFKYHQSDGEGSIFLRHEFRHGFLCDRWELMAPFLFSGMLFSMLRIFASASGVSWWLPVSYSVVGCILWSNCVP